MKPPRALPPNFHSQEHGGVEPPHHFFFLPARSVLPLLRAPLGYRMVHPSHTLPLAVGLIILPPIGWALYGAFLSGTGRHVPQNTGHIYLVGFALLSAAASLASFARRWWGQRRNEPVHSAEAGYSWLTWHTRLPVGLCEMLLVPLATFTVGWTLRRSVSLELGWWLMLSGCSLFGMGWWEHRRNWSQRRSAIDEMQRAQAYEARFTGPKPTPSDTPVIAELGEGLRPQHSARRARASDEQRRNVGARAGGSHSSAQSGDDAFF